MSARPSWRAWASAVMPPGETGKIAERSACTVSWAITSNESDVNTSSSTLVGFPFASVGGA